jgi:hypothetical protein
MQQLMRRVVVPVLAVVSLSLAATAAGAYTGQPKPAITAEAERSPQGAKITLKGKNWPGKARIKLTGTRAPGSNGTQEFGMAEADDAGAFTFRKTIQCTTNRMDDAERDPVTFTAVDSATGVKATAKTDGSAWVCQ